MTQVSVPDRIVGIEWFFNPHQIELIQSTSHAQRSCPIPLLIGVDHQRHIITDVLTYRGNAPDIFLIIR